MSTVTNFIIVEMANFSKKVVVMILSSTQKNKDASGLKTIPIPIVKNLFSDSLISQQMLSN